MLHFTVYGYAELCVYKVLFSHFSMIILLLPSYKWITTEQFPYLVARTINTLCRFILQLDLCLLCLKVILFHCEVVFFWMGMDYFDLMPYMIVLCGCIQTVQATNDYNYTTFNRWCTRIKDAPCILRNCMCCKWLLTEVCTHQNLPLLLFFFLFFDWWDYGKIILTFDMWYLYVSGK